MIAQVIKVLGYSVPTASIKLEDNYLSKYELSQNHPNPFNPATKIKYSIPLGAQRDVSVQLKVYDVLGDEIALLVNEEKPPGTYEVEFSRNLLNQVLTSGIYFYQLQIEAKNGVQPIITKTKKMILLK